MDKRGLWELFYRTGLPEAWLALAGERKEDAAQGEELAAFQLRTEKV